MIGRKLRIGPGLAMPNTPDKWPCWKTNVTAPSAARMLST